MVRDMWLFNSVVHGITGIVFLIEAVNIYRTRLDSMLFRGVRAMGIVLFSAIAAWQLYIAFGFATDMGFPAWAAGGNITAALLIGVAAYNHMCRELNDHILGECIEGGHEK